MEKEPMTYERLCELKPSDDNPVVLERISKISTSGNCVKIKSSHLDKNGHMWAISGENSIYTIGRHNLSSYYHKTESKTIELTEKINIYGDIGFYDSLNRSPDFIKKSFTHVYSKRISFPGARKILIDSETFEVIDE